MSPFTQRSIVVGLDLSLAATGVVTLGILRDGEELEFSDLIKTKPDSEKTPLAEIERLLRIKQGIIEIIEKVHSGLCLVVIEGLAFSIRNTTALVQLAGLNYLIREYLLLRKIPFVIVAPTTLKKFITSKGNAQKDLMLLETFKRYGRTYTDDNLCDGHALAQVGLALLGKNKVPLDRAQTEVLTLLTPQYELCQPRN